MRTDEDTERNREISLDLDPGKPNSSRLHPSEVEPVAKPGVYKRFFTALGRIELALSSYILINLTTSSSYIFFRILNRTRVYGRRRIGLERNTLILSNHQTMIDSYLLAHLSAWPGGVVFPHVQPFHPAAKENFFRNRLISWFSRRWKCIPVRRHVKDFEALEKMKDALLTGHMIIFPEGTRSRTGELLRGRQGTGKLIKDTRCKCIPVYVEGMNQILPIKSSFPKFFKRIKVNFGSAIRMDDLFELPSGKETSQRIIDRVMAHIALLKDELQVLEAERLSRRRAFFKAAYKVFLQPILILRRLWHHVR